LPQDTHEWTTTVREALRFSAHLRQPQSVSVEEKNEYVEDIIELLELQDLADGMIGFPSVTSPLIPSDQTDNTSGASVFQSKVGRLSSVENCSNGDRNPARKRVTIGVELAAKPELLLVLDEPTSGLDGQSAYNIVRFLRKLTAAGQKILCTIHQPK